MASRWHSGIAIAGKITGADYRTYVLTGDGEQQEGSNWEAAMSAGASQGEEPHPHH